LNSDIISVMCYQYIRNDVVSGVVLAVLEQGWFIHN